MALTVEDGTGLPDADSYASIAEADDYHLLFGDAREWEDARDAQKEVALRIATLYIDTTYQNRWLGVPVSQFQSLAWPQLYQHGQTGISGAFNELPRGLKYATAEAALRNLQEPGGLLADPMLESGLQSESIKLGPLSETTVYAGARSIAKKYPKIESHLKYLIVGRGTMERG